MKARLRRQNLGRLVAGCALGIFLSGAVIGYGAMGVPYACWACYENLPVWVCVLLWGCPEPPDAPQMTGILVR